MSSDTLRWTFSQQFLAEFQAKRTDLESRITQAKSSGTPPKGVLDILSADFAKLSKSLVDATGSLPNFDQKNCELQLKQLEATLQSIRESSVPKAKFAFKRKVKTETQTNNTPSNPTSVTTPAPLKESDSGPSQALSISSHSNTHLLWTSIPGSLSNSQPDLAISDLNRCILDLARFPSQNLTISALHVWNVSDSVLILPRIPGSAMLHDLKNCVVILGCHQFRMHTSQHVDVYLSIQSNPIIEHCTGIRFDTYPRSILREETAEETDSVLSVQDFSHIKSTPSPNWRMLSNVEKLDSKESWYDELKELSFPSSNDVSRILDKLLPAAGTSP
ncbi:tubulin-specific chaperone [Moniliophthora roreri MCA 2997]|uniref:Tubulin-specific chaperone n=2 Tax=Moniliophthora roreri TaxID=221103 RepID=V2XYM2_MONRO|nr:tubulin-specific chaperone [Moniliophthora roreri MCA 2997]